MNSTIKILIFLALVYGSLQAGLQCNVTNCQTCPYPNVCGQCNPGYVLWLNQSSGGFYCIAPSNCPVNCATCYQNNTCQACNSNYFLTINGTCSTNQTSASSIPSNCLWGSNSASCSLCSYGFTL